MKHIEASPQQDGTSRRGFLQTSATAVLGAGFAAQSRPLRGQEAAASDVIRLGLVGCGGRGRGAAVQALRADPRTKLVGAADAFEDQLHQGLSAMRGQRDVASRIEIDASRRFVGLDAYEKLLEADVDVVLLATPPHFRPLHLQACIEAGKHVFAEKPVAVDAPGVRSVLATTELARTRNLAIVSGLNSRYSSRMQEMMRRLHDGAIGDIVAIHAVRYASGVWVRPRKPDMTEMQYQMRNWYYFTWLSGDFNVEQFVHQYDQTAWALQDQTPLRCYSTGGRQARTGAEYGHIFDHFASVFEYESGVRAFTTTRHQPGCSSEREVVVLGTQGKANISGRSLEITGSHPWRPPRDPETDSHQLEHDAFFAALRRGRTINNGVYMAHSTMMAIMARMSAYTGQSLSWQQALDSREDLSPDRYEWDAEPPPAEVAVPGVTKFV